MGNKPASTDEVIARIAARQHGVVTTLQLEAAGIRRQSIAKRAKIGRLHRIHRGVYAVGHAGLGNEGRWMGAVLACGEGAALSHRSAAELWDLLKPAKGPVHMIVPTAAGREQRFGLRIHRSPLLPPRSTTARRGIPVTTVARTLADLRATLAPHLVRRAIRQAEYLGFDTGLETDHTRSDAEGAFLRLCRRHRLPLPEVNVPVGRFTVDFLWRAQRLVVEVDGYAAHRGRQGFEDDRERDLYLNDQGLRVRRFSAAQVERTPGALAVSLRADLAP